jgi:hypothetical protein
MDVLDETQREKLREEFRTAGGGPGGPGGRFGSPPRDGERPREQGERPDGARRGGPEGPGSPEGRGGPDGAGQRRGQRDQGQMISRIRENLSELKLNDDQKQKVDALLSETEKKLTDLRAEADKQAQETRTKFREAFESNKQKLDSILTEEQKKKLQELTPQPPQRGGDGERRGGGDRPGRGGPPPEARDGDAKPKE